MNKKYLIILIYSFIIIAFFYSLDKEVSDISKNKNINFNEAIKLYKSNDYDKALVVFENLYKNHYNNFNINYNLGCCYFKLGQYGKARFHFERALKFKPFDKDLFHNLKATYKNISKDSSNYEYIIMNKRIIYFFPLRFLIITIIVLFILLIIFGILLLKAINARLFLILVTVSLFFLILFTTIFFIQYYDYNKRVCVVVKNKSNIYLSPDDENAILKSVDQGTEGKIISETSQYFRVKFENNINGWINKKSVITNR